MNRFLAKVPRIAVIVAVLSASYVSVATAQLGTDSGELTGDYLLDARPNQLLYLSLTQAGQFVSGYMLVVEPDTNGTLTNEQFTVEGSTNGESVSLVIGSWLSGQVTMSGSKQDSDLYLSYPTDSGEIETVHFVSAAPDAFNQVLSEWQAIRMTEDELRYSLPTEADMPAGLTQVNEYPLTLNDITATYPTLHADQLAAWGWQATVARLFSSDQGSVPSNELISAFVYLHRFGSADAAGEALATYAKSDDAGKWDVTQADPGGDQVQVLTALGAGDSQTNEWIDVAVYARSETTVIHVIGMAFQGDPTADTIDIARKLFDPAYRATTTELAAHISTLEDAAGEIDGLEREVQGTLDGIHDAVDELQTLLTELKDQAAQPLDCFGLEGLSFTYSESMGFIHKETLTWERDQYDLSMADLEAAVIVLEQTLISVEQTMRTLDTFLEAMPAPLTGEAEEVFGDEEVMIASYATLTSDARTNLDTLNTDVNAAVIEADEIMAEGQVIVDDAAASIAC